MEPFPKWCPECGEWKVRADFFTDRRSSNGLTSYCKPCLTRRTAESKARRAAGEPRDGRRRARRVESTYSDKMCPRCERTLPLERFAINRTRSRGISAYCLECHNDVVRENIQKNHGSTRNYHLKGRYGLTATEVAAMVAEQGGMCAICLDRPAEHVDHDHETGEVRGVLCFTCNVGLGNFRDRPDLLDRAVHYLEDTFYEDRLRLWEEPA